MGKTYGERYDPEIRYTDHGIKIYRSWVRMNKGERCEEWKHFPAFYEWAVSHGYEDGAWLAKHDKSKPFSPENCSWYIPTKKYQDIPPEMVAKWNETVNRIRKHYGMPPLEEDSVGR